MKKRIGMLITVLVFGAFAAACSSNGPSVVNPATTQVTYDLSIVVTTDARSYIPINKWGNPGDNPSEILLILQAFEDAHPELEVTGWKIEKQQNARALSAKIFGIWVDHKLKVISGG